MKFELKTENEKYLNSFSDIFKSVFIIVFAIISFDVAFKLGFISKHYQIKYICSLLSVEKSTANFKKLSNLSKLKSKQKIWEFCKIIIN